jgi:iron complex transport system substrate-binding protein
MLAALACSLALAGCGPAKTGAPPPGGAPRVVSLAPSLTEMVCALGGAGQLAGRSSACDYPPDIVGSVPVVGNFGIPSLERLLAVKPSAVLYADLKDKALDAKLARLGLRPVRIACKKLDDIPAALLAVGRQLDRADEARRQAAALRDRIAQARSAPAPQPRPRVLVLIWNDPLTAAGSHSFVSDLVTLAGGRNVADDVGRDYFPVSSEWVVAHDPEVILCLFMAKENPVRESILNFAGWSHVPAVRSGRVYDGFDNRLVLRPGPRVMDGVAALRARIEERHE